MSRSKTSSSNEGKPQGKPRSENNCWLSNRDSSADWATYIITVLFRKLRSPWRVEAGNHRARTMKVEVIGVKQEESKEKRGRKEIERN